MVAVLSRYFLRYISVCNLGKLDWPLISSKDQHYSALIHCRLCFLLTHSHRFLWVMCPPLRLWFSPPLTDLQPLSLSWHAPFFSSLADHNNVEDHPFPLLFLPHFISLLLLLLSLIFFFPPFGPFTRGFVLHSVVHRLCFKITSGTARDLKKQKGERGRAETFLL